MELTTTVFVVAAVATLVGATIQGAIGFGMNLVTVPVLALLVPESLPVSVIVLGLPISITMFLFERASVDREGILWIFVGRLPATVVGAAVVAAVSTTTLQAIVGILLLAMVAASAAMPPIPVDRRTQTAAGAVAGLTGTTAGIGGPPLALLYQRYGGPTIRSTLAASFLFGTIVSLGALSASGSVAVDQLAFGAGLSPFVIAGVLVGRRAHALLDRGWMRPAVLTFACLSAVVVLVEAWR
jgi:uncharacterized protein